MKKLFLLALVISATSFTTNTGDPLSKEDRDFAVNYYNATKARLLKDVTGLSEAQLNFKADSTRWSVMECLEHIALAESFILEWAKGTMKTPEEPAKRTEVKVTKEKLIEGTTNRERKLQAPEPIRPAGQFPNAKAALDAYVSRRDSTIQYLQTTKDALKDHFTLHPFFGTIDTYSVYIFLAAHSERHTKQIEEVIANPNFPKK